MSVVVGHNRSVHYYQAFPELAAVHVEDSWVLDIAPSQHVLAFRMEVVLTPEHPRYRPPDPNEQHCYFTGWLILQSSEPVELQLSGASPNIDPTGSSDLGQIDVFVTEGDHQWELDGEWGCARIQQCDWSSIDEPLSGVAPSPGSDRSSELPGQRTICGKGVR